MMTEVQALNEIKDLIFILLWVVIIVGAINIINTCGIYTRIEQLYKFKKKERKEDKVYKQIQEIMKTNNAILREIRKINNEKSKTKEEKKENEQLCTADGVHAGAGQTKQIGRASCRERVSRCV